MVRKKKLLNILLITSILIVCFWGVLYFVSTKSEPYRFAVGFINNNPIIKNKVGALRKERLGFWGYSVRYSGPHGYAEFEICITGEDASGTVYLDLEKSAGIWHVHKAHLLFDNGTTIPLSQSSD